jgi:hypothetical protein
LASTPSLPNQRVRTTGEGCLFVLDDAGVFFSVAHQELYVFNTAATFIWCCIEEGFSPGEIVGLYCNAFGASPREAQQHVAMALDQWWSAGYIDAVELAAAPAVSFETALARLLVNDRLRTAFARDPQEIARRLRLEDNDRDALVALEPARLEQQARLLQDRKERRAILPSGANTLFCGVTDGDRALLELAVDGRVQSLVERSERSYRLLDTNFRLNFASAEAESCVHAALGHLAIDEAAESHVTFDVVGGSDGYAVLDGLIPVRYARELEQLAPLVKNAVAVAAITRCRLFLQLHAGVVSNGERCILFPGAAGSGKTTLTAGLTFAGFSYFSDEVAVLEEDTLGVRPFPLALGVKRGALKAIAELWPDAEGLEAHTRIDGEQVRYLALPAERCATAETACAAGWIIFPRYGADFETELRPISRADALHRMIHECMIPPRSLDERRVEKLVQWMRTLECYELPMSSLGKAVELVTECCRRQQ